MTWKEVKDKIDAVIEKVGKTDDIQVRFIYADGDEIDQVMAEVVKDELEVL